MKLAIQVTNYDSGLPEFITTGSLAEVAVASLAVPFLTSPVILNNKRYVDGDMSPDFGVDVLRTQFQARKIIGLQVKHDELNSSNPITQGVETFLHTLDRINELSNKLHPVDLLVNLEHVNFPVFDFADGEKIYGIGYEFAKSKLNELTQMWK
jgi:predicted acylesterase/phospholipase RssA